MSAIRQKGCECREQFQDHISVDVGKNQIPPRILRNGLNTAGPDLYPVRDPVDQDVFLCIFDTPGIHIKCDDGRCAKLCSGNGQNSCPCPDIEYCSPFRVQSWQHFEHEPGRRMISRTKSHFWIYLKEYTLLWYRGSGPCGFNVEHLDLLWLDRLFPGLLPVLLSDLILLHIEYCSPFRVQSWQHFEHEPGRRMISRTKSHFWIYLKEYTLLWYRGSGPCGFNVEHPDLLWLDRLFPGLIPVLLSDLLHLNIVITGQTDQ